MADEGAVAPESAPVAATTPETEPEAPAKQVVPAGPGRAYETLVLFYARLDGEPLKTAAQEVQQTIEQAGGIAVEQDDKLGRRKLAYGIADQTEGVYINFKYVAPPAAVKRIDDALKLNESVLRSLTTRQED